MKPEAPLVLADLAQKLRQTILPCVTGFEANTVAMAAAMLEMAAEMWDGAADELVRENTAVAALLVRGSEVTGDATFAATAAEMATDYKVSTLERVNDSLRHALITLHAGIEPNPDDAARALDSDIWRELRASTERRRLSLANF